MNVIMEQGLSADGGSYEARIQVQNTDRPDTISVGIEGPDGFVYARICRRRWIDLQEVAEVVFDSPRREE